MYQNRDLLTKREGLRMEPLSFWNWLPTLRNRVHKTRARGEFATQICASIVCNRGLVLIPIVLPFLKIFFSWDCILF